MNLCDIKYGDILVAYYPEIDLKIRERNYIIFIANGKVSEEKVDSKYIFATIGVIAAINLVGKFLATIVEEEKRLSIGFTTWSKDANETSILRKPTFSEMAEFIATMKANNFRYNRKKKKIEYIV